MALKELSMVLIFLPSCMYSQDIFQPKESKLQAPALRIKEEVIIDGQLMESVWNDAKVLDNFIQVEPNQGQPSLFKTEVRLLYDNTNLYIGVFCEDLEGPKGFRVPEMSRDFSFSTNDTFAVGFDGFLDGRNSVTIAVNPYEAQKDYLSFDDTFFDSEWNGLWRVRTSIADKGWYAEYAIPWKTLRYKIADPMESSIWGINFVRQRRKSNEISAWSPYPRAFGFNRSEYFGRLTQIHPPKPKSNIQINPYFLGGYEEIKENEVLQNKENRYKVGGEVKWAINSNTLLDLTINTDFAQAEADLQVNNTTRFSIFFPERRQFFLENASLFGVGLFADDGTSGDMIVAPFFSRRIGLNSKGNPLPIDAGVRLVHQSSSKNYGLLALREGNTGLEDERYNFVGRYVKNFGKQNRIGIIHTARVSENNTNLISGVDGFFRLSSSQSLSLMALNSFDTQNKKPGFGGYVQYKYETNDWNAFWTSTVLHERFNPSLGFISRQDVVSNALGFIANYRGKSLPKQELFRAFQPRITARLFHQSTSLTLTEREVNISPFWLEFQNGSIISYTTKLIHQNILKSFPLLGEEIAVGRYNYNRHQFNLSSDPSAKFSASINYEIGDFYNGTMQTINASVNVNPISHVALRGTIVSNRFKEFGSLKMDNTADLITLQGRLFLNARVSLSGHYQKNIQINSDFFNFRVAWEYRPQSFLFFVINSNVNDTLPNEHTQFQGFFKINFLKQF